MSLTPVQLDSLTWNSLVNAIRTRIIADSRGQWTLHAPVDPGVTMLELFAWLLDQRIYWMDQVPDALVLAILALLGQAPKAAIPAVTVLQFDNPRTFQTVAAGTAMRLIDSEPPLIFSTDRETTLLPLAGEIGMTVDGVDRSKDLAQGRPVSLIAPSATFAEILITLRLSSAIPAAMAGKFFSLMFELETPAAIAAEWTREAVANVPALATLRWSHDSTAQNTSVFFNDAAIQDGTGGLRRGGLVQLSLPGDWKQDQGSTNTYTVRLQIEKEASIIVPRLVRILTDVAEASHVWQRTKQFDAGRWLPQLGNSLALAPTEGLPEFPPLENSVKLTITESRTGQTGNPVVHDWLRVNDFSAAGPDSRVFVVDRDRSQILFGDGLTGRLPVNTRFNAFTMKVEYQAGGGLAGNVGDQLSWEPVDLGASVSALGATNVVRGEGGAESESLAAARQRVQSLLNERNRAVTKDDYENLAQTTPGLGLSRAFAAIGFHPLFPCVTMPGVVTVFVVPYAPREDVNGLLAEGRFVAAPQPDAGALQAVRARLDAARLAGSEVYVQAPAYRAVQLALEIAVDSPLSPDLRRQIVNALRIFLDPLIGGDNRDGWPFGGALRPSSLLKVAQGVLGNTGDVLRVSVLLDAMDHAESCLDVRIQPHELVWLKKVDLAFQQRAVPAGGLR